jgi:hypothetical protein
MKLLNRRRGIRAAGAAAAVLFAALLAYPMGSALSQQPPTTDHVMPDHGQMPDKMQHHQQMMQMHGPGPGQTATTSPTMPGQDAFGAVQEIVGILEADPKTDWSKVNLEALRQHLIDMNEVTLKADAVAKPIDGGVEIAVTGSGRTLVAIQHMVPTWAETMNGYNGWVTKVTPLPNGELLTVTAADPKEVPHIRGLGFIGLMASGAHHQLHHLAMARGEFGHHH